MIARASVVLLVLAVPWAVAQTHPDHAGGLRIVATHDLSPEGLAWVGDLTHLGFVLLDENGVPSRHHDASVVLRMGNSTLFSSNDTHEYDGIYSLHYVFTQEGPFTFEVSTTSEGKVLRSFFHGTALLPQNRTTAQLHLDVPEGITVGTPARFVLGVEGPEGKILPHTDALVEIVRLPEERIVFRTHLHTHARPMEFQLSFDLPGEYRIIAYGYTAFPTKRGVFFDPVVERKEFVVSSSPPSVPKALLPQGAPLDHPGHSPSFDLHLTFDPDNVTGPWTQTRIGALVLDGSEGAPVAHVDLDWKIEGPQGVVFQSSTLHTYDGIQEVLLSPFLPGEYHVVVQAQQGERSRRAEGTFRVLPPLLPLGTGTYGVRFAEKKGSGGVEGEIALEGPTGRLAHSEVDLGILSKGGVPLLLTKLHAHDGVSSFFFAPFADPSTLEIRPESLEPSPTLFVEEGKPKWSWRFDLSSHVAALLSTQIPSPPSVARESPVGLEWVVGGVAALLFLGPKGRKRRDRSPRDS